MSASSTIKRFNTEYVDLEDRIRLSCEMEKGQQIIWLTQRLLQRLIPILLQRLEQLQGSDRQKTVVPFTFAQQPVRLDATSWPSVWLVHSIDISSAREWVKLVFKAQDGHSAAVVFHEEQLRNWLEIVYDTSLLAQWPLDAWSSWIVEHASVFRAPQSAVWQ